MPLESGQKGCKKTFLKSLLLLFLAHFGLRKIHSRILLLNLAQDFLLLLLVRARQTHLFLALVVHHFFHNPARLSVQICQLDIKSIR